MDNRSGKKFRHAAFGYDESCFPKGTLALLKTAEDFEKLVHIVKAVVKVNDARKRKMGRKVLVALTLGNGAARPRAGRSRCSA